MHPIFIPALSTIAKLWRKPKCPSTTEGIKEVWGRAVCVYIYVYTYICIYVYTYIDNAYIHTMEYYSAIKKNEMLPIAMM